MLKVEGVLTHRDILEMPEDDLIDEYERFAAHMEAKAEAHKEAMKRK